jgi:DNA modification methylase
MSDLINCTCEHCGHVFEAAPIGKHRVLCGDSCDESATQALLGAEKASLVATDPPYGVAYDGNQHRRQTSPTRHGSGVLYDPIENDDLVGEEFQQFLARAFAAIEKHVKEDAAWYVWHASKTRPAFLSALAKVGVTIHQEIIWTKENFQFSRSDYHWQHEPCLYGWREKHEFLGERNQSTVWSIARQTEHQHPTSKPVELWARPIRNHLKPGEIVLDTFLGSGTALIAAEQMQVRCFGSELSPNYTDVCILRWQRLTSREAVLQETGQTFREVAQARGVVIND